VRISSSQRHVAAFVALASLLPTCSLVDLSGLSGAMPGDGGGVEGGEAGVVGDAHLGSDVQDAPANETNDDGNGKTDGNGKADGVADVVTDVGSDVVEAGPLSYAATVLSDGPIAYWRLDDTTTATAKDSSGNGHDGTYQGGVTLGAQGAIANDTDKAVQFGGGGAEMVANVPSSFDFAGNVQYSVELWAMPASGPAGMGLVGTNAYLTGTGYSGWYVACNSNGYLDNWRNNVETGNPAPAPGVFIHVVATYDGTNLALYVNGQSFSTNASAAALSTTGAPLTAGGVANWGWFTGVLDEIAIYDKVLPQARIAAHYARGTGH
jgi:hypothetical protein